MTWKFLKYPTSLILLALALTSCFQSDYTKLVKRELAKGVRYDSILLGIPFGFTRQEFYGRCFDLNAAHLVMEGPNGQSVQYLFVDSLVHSEPTKLRLLFMPGYDSTDRIAEMRMELSYELWAPWAKGMQTDSLEGKTKQLLMKWYNGNEFITTKVGEKDILVKLDGNRRILLQKIDKQSMAIEVQDILNHRFVHTGVK
ncbi:MAG: hypothetical protein HOP08_00195 [Cyclobacteriaceae bacterium]|nr:hypothetical protein [Cyclobacteriaceae bacterium]